jgi:conjugal transfer pilus assembly protein TraF
MRFRENYRENIMKTRSSGRGRYQKTSFFLFPFSLSLILLFLTPINVYAEQQQWWQKHDQGWFFYEDPPVIQEPEEKAPPHQEPIIEENAPLFSDVMRKKGDELRSKALERPTVENVKEYMVHNKQMIDVSQNFTNAWEKVLMSYPELSSNNFASDAVKDIVIREVAKENTAILQNLAQRTGLFFFYSATCPYCQRQALYLKEFQSKYPFFTIKPITVDGAAFAEFPDTIADNGLAQTLGVETVPSLFLAFPPDRFDRIATGPLTPDELERRLLSYEKNITDHSDALN